MKHLLLIMVCCVSLGATVYERDNGRTIGMRSDEVLRVKLQVPTGVPAWQVSYIDRGFFIQSNTDVRGDTQTFQFLPIRQGITRLELRYTRPIERGYNPPFRIYRLQVIIN
jgi:hypothetical protein